MGQLAIVEVDGKKQYQYIDSWEICDRQLTQQQANYNPLGATATKGCANCNWFLSPGRCVVVEGTISPTGVSDLWMACVEDVPAPILVQIIGMDPDNDGDVDGAIVSAKDTLDAKKRNALPDSSFAWVDSAGKGHLPINDEAHVRAAMSRWNQTKFDSAGAKSSAKSKIAAAAKKYGIDASGFTGTKDADLGSSGQPNGLMAGLRRLVTEFSGVSGSAPPPAVPAVVGSEGRLNLFKQKDGRTRFLTAWSNNFMDREGEIFTESAHKEYIEWADSSQQFPELWLWHTKGTKYGQVDWLDYTDGFVYASGLIDAGREDLADALVKEDCGVSHGFHGLQRGKEIIMYRPFEISTLPRTNAAVWTTSFNIIGEGAKEMAFTQVKKDWLKQHGLDDAAIAAAETQATSLSKALREAGVAYKDVDLVEEPVAADKAAAKPAAKADDDEDDPKKAKTAGGNGTGGGMYSKEVEDGLAVMVANSTKQTEILGALATTIAGFETRIKAIERTDDEKIAGAIGARNPNPGGVAASKDATNVVDQKQNDADRDFFGTTFLAPMGVGANGSAT